MTFCRSPMLDMLEQLVSRRSTPAAVPISVCGEAASRPLEALVLAALGVTTLSMPASAILPIKAMFAQVDLQSFRSVLAAIRRGGGFGLREPVATWAREQAIIVVNCSARHDVPAMRTERKCGLALLPCDAWSRNPQMLQFKALEKLIVWSRSRCWSRHPGRAARRDISTCVWIQNGAASAAGTQVETG